jgi:VCBS repeat-containing protein
MVRAAILHCCCCAAFICRHGVFKVETAGDAYMAVAGHDGSSDHTLRMAAMAVDMLAAAEEVQHQILVQGKDGRRVQIRIGMHTGEAGS